MKARLYFLLPDVDSARQLANDLLLARVEDHRMHFLAKRGTDLGELHEASAAQKTDLVHGAERGLVLGGVLGAALGLAMVFFPPANFEFQLVTVLVLALLGALFGTWVSSMIGSQMANSQLAAFQGDIEQGRVLLMLDLPMTRASAITELVHAKHPEAVDRGREPLVPAFP